MSSPTPGSDPNYPQGGEPQGQSQWNAPQGQPLQGQPQWNAPQGQPPQGQPQWNAPQQPGPSGYDPAPSYSGAPAGYGAPAGTQRPGQVTAAAIIGIVWGALGALFALVIMLAAFSLGAGVAGLIFLIALALYVALLVGGIFVVQNKPPKLLLYVSYAAIALGVISLIVSIAATGGNAASGVIGIVIAGVIVFLLMQPQSKQYYASRGMSY